METKLLHINPRNPDPAAIQQAASVIHSGALCAFPTETVYGLGANALSPEAVIKVFEAKKRDLADPLIVHISKIEDIKKLASNIPHQAEILIEQFWPGPLTLVLQKSAIVPDVTTAGLDTVAIRMPAGSIARALIEEAGVPVAAPSANLFGRPSPTKAEHVLDDLDGSIDMVLDGGQAEIGVESTVVEFDGDKTVILRPGGITAEEIKKVTPNVLVCSIDEVVEKSPGKYPQHYSPEAEVVIIEDGPLQRANLLEAAKQYENAGKKVGIMAKKEHAEEYSKYTLKIAGSELVPAEWALNLYSILRDLDKEKVAIILAEAIPEANMGAAVMNRLRKAAG